MDEPLPTILFLGLGSNLGDRKSNLRQALTLLASHLNLDKVSSLYETEPVDYLDQPRFLNAACQASTTATPETVLAWAKETEMALGRVATVRYGPRTLDIDILLYGSQVLDTPNLVLPHPRLSERAFALVPLAEIAPDTEHPALKRSAQELLEAAPEREGVRLMEGRDWWRGVTE